MTLWRAALAWRLPPRFSLWRLVLPLEAGTGQAPHILANAASERMRSGLSPTRISISAALPVAMPGAVMSSGVWTAASASSSRSCPAAQESNNGLRLDCYLTLPHDLSGFIDNAERSLLDRYV